MARMYPQELLDIESTSDCIRATVSDWIAGGLNDKTMAMVMNGHCGILKRDIVLLKERYRREEKVTSLELTGEEVAT